MWQEIVRENAHKENLGLHNQYEEGICTKERECVFIVKGGKRGGV